MKNFFDGWNNDDKGEFFENVMYDYYDYWGYNPVFIRSDKNGRQRLKDARHIVMPDILCSYSDGIFFVECKSDFKMINLSRFVVSESLEESYKNFYREIYPNKIFRNSYNEAIPTIVSFGKIDPDDSFIMKIYLMNIEKLGETKMSKSLQGNGELVSAYHEKGISENAYNEDYFRFGFDGIEDIHHGLFDLNNIYNRNRQYLEIQTKKEFQEYLKNILE